jgi:hypothetical protein
MHQSNKSTFRRVSNRADADLRENKYNISTPGHRRWLKRDANRCSRRDFKQDIERYYV